MSSVLEEPAKAAVQLQHHREDYRLPPPIMRAGTHNFTLGHLVLAHTEKSDRKFWGDDPTPWLCGHRLPPFQRPAVWVEAQQVRFIESAWLGLHLGTYVVNRNDAWVGGKPHRTDLWLIDGQQRLRAIECYLDGVFEVFGYTWSQLNKVEHRRFESLSFAQSVVHESNEDVLRELYDRLNFGGTPHTEDQRAVKGRSERS